MATPAAAYPALSGAARSRAVASARAPWSIYAVLFASLSVILGVIWDISWHRTIGRDTFWTPAHLAIYTGGIVAGLTCGWVALTTTFGGIGDGARLGGPLLGLPRAARRVGLHLGGVRDGHLRAVRRLVAQRLRAGRENHQPAAHAARGRHRRDPVRCDADGARRARTAPSAIAGISGACICSAPDSSCCWSRRWRPNTRSAGTCTPRISTR